MWSTFAATHQPITEDKSKSSSSGLTWSQRSPKEKIYLNITKEPTMESSTHYWARMAFWRDTVQAGC